MPLLVLLSQAESTATVVTCPPALASAQASATVIGVSPVPPAATASGLGTVPTLAIRTSPPTAVTSLAIAIGTVTDPPLLEIAVSVPAPVASAEAIAIAPIIQTVGPATVVVMPAALATALASPPTQVGTGNATVLSSPSATATASAVVPGLATRIPPVSAVASAIGSDTIVAVSIPAPRATATGNAVTPIIIIVGIPTGLIRGRIVIIDRIAATLEIVG